MSARDWGGAAARLGGSCGGGPRALYCSQHEACAVPRSWDAFAVIAGALHHLEHGGSV